MAIVGIAAGGKINRAVLHELASRPVAVVGCVLATMVVTLLCGQILRLSPHVTPVTALFASIAGGASGVTAVVHEIGGDDAVVMAIQYLRVVAVIVLVPIAAQAFDASASAPPAVAAQLGAWAGLDFTAVCIVVGLALSRLLTFSASRLIFPLLVAVALSVGDVFTAAVVPPVLAAVGFAMIGLMVGLAMTRGTLRVLIRVLPFALVQLVLVLGACFVIGLVLARTTGISDMDAYLASTPGGLPAVTAIAVSSGASVGVVITVQLVRVFTALGLAAALGEFYIRGAAREDGA